MSIDKYKDDIIRLISEKGPLGVNTIQREIGVPLSTLQKYLHRQTYFRINEDRKWDLPENVIGEIKTNSLGLMTNVVETSILLLKSQLEEVLQSVDNALSPISVLKKGVNAVSTPVAGISPNIHPRLLEMDEKAKGLLSLFNKYVSKTPEEYHKLLKNVDLHRLIIEKGTIYVSTEFSTDISALFVGESETLSEDTVNVLNTYQMGD